MKPTGKSSKIELIAVREAPDLKELDSETYSTWGQGLTPQQYRAREQILRETPHCRRAHRHWAAMVNGRRVSSCETFALPFVYRGLRYVAWTVASVFTSPEARGKGYASQMLKELLTKAKSERISMLVLYSEIGTTLYSRLGFEPRPNFVARRKVPKTFVQWPAGVVPVDERAPLNQRSGSDLTFIVDEAITFWHRARSHLYARAYDCRYTDVSGARLRGAHTLWAPEWRSSFLRILYRSAAAPEVTSRLMTAAVVHAQRFGLSELEWWCPSRENEPFAESIVPNIIIPMALSLDPEIPVASMTPHDRVLWA